MAKVAELWALKRIDQLEILDFFINLDHKVDHIIKSHKILLHAVS